MSMEIVSCAKCGEPLLDDTQGCPFCGAPPKSAASVRKSAPPAVDSKAPDPAPPTTRKPSVKRSQPAPRKSDRIDLDDDVELTLAAEAKPSTGPEEDSAPAVSGPRKARYQLDDKYRGFMDTALPVRADARATSDIEVMCPICRTTGFIPPTAVDRPLRCRNAACPAPVYVHRRDRPAQPFVSEDEPAALASRRRTGLWIMRGAAIVLVLAVIGGWWWNKSLRPAPSTPPSASNRPKFPQQLPPPPREQPPQNQPEKTAAGGVTDLERKAVITASLVESFANAPPNRRATGLRLSATSAAAWGDFTAAQEQLAQFRVVPELTSYQFEAIEPLTLLAWKHLEAGRQAAFLEAVVSAGEAARKLPPRGSAATQAAITLAAAMAVADRKNEALQLLDAHRNGNDLDDLAAALAIAHEDGTFDVSQLLPGQTLGNWERPLPAAVTYILVSRRQNKTAETWAQSQRDDIARTECRLLRASLVAEQSLTSRPTAEASLATLPGLGLSPEAEARWHARLAMLYLAHGLKPAANATLDLAGRVLPKFPTPPAVRIVDVQELLAYKLPPENPQLRTTVATAAELAYAQARLGRMDAAAASLTAALAQWRGTAPSLLAIQAIDKSFLSGSPSAARQKLRQVLDLETDDAAARELTRLRQKLAQLQPAAERRFQNQEKLLLAAMNWGLLEPVWKEVQLRQRNSDPNELEPYLRSPIPQFLARKFAAAGQTAQQQEVEALLARFHAALGSSLPIDNPLPLIQESVTELAAGGKAGEAGRLLNAHLRGDEGELPLWTLQLASRLAVNGQFDKVVELLSPIQQATIREDGFRLTASLATLQRQEQQVLGVAASRQAGFPLEAAALYAGVLEALARRSVDTGKSAASPQAVRP